MESPSSIRVLMVIVASLPRRWRWWWCRRCSPLLLLAVSTVLWPQWPSSLDHVVPLLVAYVLMPPATDRTTVTATAGTGLSGGSRVRETKKALLGRSAAGGGRGCPRSSAPQSSPSSSAVPFVAKGTVSKITEKFQGRPLPPSPLLPPSRVATRIPKLSSSRSTLPPPPPPPIAIKNEIKRRQEKLLGELHRSRNITSLSVGRLPILGDNAISSDCGSSSDSEKSVCCAASVASVATVDEDKPGSPHSSGYESVEETSVAVDFVSRTTADDFIATTDGDFVVTTDSVSTAVPYSWVFGSAEPLHDVFDGFGVVPSLSSSSVPSSFSVPSSSSSSSSDGCSEGDDRPLSTASEDRLERLVTFTPTASCLALPRAKPDQDDDQHALVRRHFGGNDASTPNAVACCMAGGYLSPIPECSSTEPNSVETVEDCRYDGDDDKVYNPAWISG